MSKDQATVATVDQTRRQLLLAGVGAAGAAAFPAWAAEYPERPITFICPWPAGGTADQTMRALCVAAAKVLGQSIVVENRVGASGMLGAKAMASAKRTAIPSARFRFR